MVFYRLYGYHMSDENKEMENGASGDHEEGKHENGGGGRDDHGRDDVCRDFLKNICNRGSRCKFYHPPEAAKPRSDDQINFCIDFQNRGCSRSNCRFVHAARDEVERYKHTQEVTLPLARAIAAVTNSDTIAGILICRDFQTGKCARGAARCRYWHVNLEQERERRARGLPPSGGDMPPPGPGMMRGGGGGGNRGGPAGAPAGYPTPMYGGPMRRPGPPMDGPFEPKRPRMAADEMRVTELERKNAELMKEIDGLKRELQRERERYEDLYALFRQQSSGGGGGGVGAGKPAGIGGGMSAPGGGGYQGGYGAGGGWGSQWS